MRSSRGETRATSHGRLFVFPMPVENPMTLTDRTFTDLLAAFRSSDPTPGGGSASALAGAVGSALLAMVAALPKPRADSDDDIGRLRTAGSTCTELCERLRVLVDKDAEAYDLVVNAYRLPKGTDEEKAERSKRIQEALRAATDTPLDVMRACAAGIAQAGVVERFGNQNASSDVRVARELLTAGLRGAKYNVEINLGSVKDPAYGARVGDEVARLASAAASAAGQGLADD
jgi:formiminotetrahydrofolate cyclodeaminase